VAINRIVAGMHFPVDAAAGAVLGLTLGQYFVNRCTNQPNYTAWVFDGTQYPDPTVGNPPPYDGDFYWTELYNVATPGQTQAGPAGAPYVYVTSAGAQNLSNPSLLLNWMWTQALGEWP
jgi:hypothetical protein